MIIDERMVTYINSLDTGHTPFLENLERTAKQTKVPIIRREMQSFLKVFLKMKQPKRILEVGTAVGFSAVFMAQYGEPDAEITTIENYEKRIPIARENFEKSGFADRIRTSEAFIHVSDTAGRDILEASSAADVIGGLAAAAQALGADPALYSLDSSKPEAPKARTLAEDIARIVHAHPSLSEVLHEACLAADKRALHG